MTIFLAPKSTNSNTTIRSPHRPLTIARSSSFPTYLEKRKIFVFLYISFFWRYETKIAGAFHIFEEAFLVAVTSPNLRPCTPLCFCRKSSSQHIILLLTYVVDGDGYAKPETEPPPTRRREAYALRTTSTPVINHFTTPIERISSGTVIFDGGTPLGYWWALGGGGWGSRLSQNE